MKFLIIFIYFIFLIIFRKIEKTYWSPNVIFILLYAFLVLFSPISKYTTCFGLIVLLSFILTFHLGSFIVDKIYINNIPMKRYFYISKKFEKYITLIFVLTVGLGYIGLLILIKKLNVEIKDFHLKSLMMISRESAVLRYKSNFQTPFLANLCFSFGYFSAFLAGFFIKELRIKVLFMFVLFGLYTVIYSTKAAFLLPSIFFISSYFMRILIERGNIVIRIKYLLIFLIIIAFIMIIASYLRYAGKLSGKEFFEHIVIYLIGNITPFTDWIVNRYNETSKLYYGEYSFRSFFVLLGFVHARAGVYNYFVPILGTESSNVHTAFRGLIEDYSLIGTYIILFIFGILSKFFYIKIKQCHFLYIAFILPIYSFILWSPVYSIFAYNSLILAHLLLIPFFWYLEKKRRYLCVVIK